MSVLFVGGGNMAAALIGGLVAHGQSLADIGVVEIQADRAQQLERDWGVKVSTTLPKDLTAIGTLVLAVKPQQLAQVLATFPALPSTLLVISIVAGWTTARLSRALQGHTQIVRAMPNMAALVQAGTTALFAMPPVTEDDRELAQALMHAVGAVHWLAEERAMDAVTALSGSGPAYVFYLMESLLAAATTLGLDATMARSLVLETVHGAARLALAGQESPALLRQRVTSPGGTTAAALEVLQQGQWSDVLQQAVLAAAQRSEALAQGASL